CSQYCNYCMGDSLRWFWIIFISVKDFAAALTAFQFQQVDSYLSLQPLVYACPIELYSCGGGEWNYNTLLLTELIENGVKLKPFRLLFESNVFEHFLCD
ncbi:hypothetical protein RYX36_030805, partial [Vicia faba]